MSLEWKSNKEQLIEDPEIKLFYDELEEEFDKAKQLARKKRAKSNK